MKKFAVLMILIFGATFAGFAQQTISKENQVILSNTSWWSEIKWTPTEEQTAKALTAIEQLLNDPEALKKFSERATSSADKIRIHFPEYGVQFYGVIKGGEKYICCNFFSANTTTSSADWKQHPVKVYDGGFWYWSILYDPSTGKLSGLKINGYA